jgi:hypothetical protein
MATLAFDHLSQPSQHGLLHTTQPHSTPTAEQPSPDHSLSQPGWGGTEHGHDVRSGIHATAQGRAWYYTYPVQHHHLSPRNPWAAYLLQPPPAVAPPCHHCGADRGEHPLDFCPHTPACLYCQGPHRGPECPTPHRLCLRNACLCPRDHLHAQPDDQWSPTWQCPVSGLWRARR